MVKTERRAQNTLPVHSGNGHRQNPGHGQPRRNGQPYRGDGQIGPHHPVQRGILGRQQHQNRQRLLAEGKVPPLAGQPYPDDQHHRRKLRPGVAGKQQDLAHQQRHGAQVQQLHRGLKRVLLRQQCVAVQGADKIEHCTA